MPTGVSLFHEINRPPRELAEPWYNIQRSVEIDDGGHFPAMENPDALVRELREFFRPRCADPSRSSLTTMLELEVELGVAADEHRRLPRGRRVGIEPERRRAREQRADRAARFEPREGRAEAEVEPAPERDVRRRVLAIETQLVGILVLERVAIGRRPEQEQVVTTRQGHATQLGVMTHVPVVTLER